jgi:small subunit ribosomal protein S1
LESLQEGDVVKGTVTGLRDFGAFVNLGGADGLIHVSELAWHRIDHPRDILNIGDEIDVFILNLDYERNRIALSRKRLLPDPWDDAIERYHEGQLVEGVVTNVVDFGAFIALDDGLEGLLHLSEMGDGTLKEPHSYVKKGDRLQLRISRLEPERRRVGFTQRWGTEQPILEDEDDLGEDVEDEVEPEDADVVDEAASQTGAEDVAPAEDEAEDDEPEEAPDNEDESEEAVGDEAAPEDGDIEVVDEEPAATDEGEDEAPGEDEAEDDEPEEAPDNEDESEEAVGDDVSEDDEDEPEKE